MKNPILNEQVLGYWSSPDPTNTDPRYLVGGSQNVLIDRQRKVKSRQGYTRFGASNTALTPVRNAWTWYTSTGVERAQKFYDDELEVYLGTVDGTKVDAWTRVLDAWSTTEIMRASTWWDTGENLDLQIMCIGNANLYEWNGAVAIVASITGTTVTKKGTSTFAQNRFYTTRNKTFIVTRTGTEFTYTGGETTTTLTGITDTTGIQAGDILIQKVITQSNKPAASRNNDTIFMFENQLAVGSFDDNEVYISQNDSYTDFTYSTPRVAGEGALLALDGPSRGFGAFQNVLVAFAGESSIFKTEFEQITVSTTLAETLKVRKLKTGINQGAYNPDVIVPVGNGLIYLSNEPALRLLDQPEAIEVQLKTLSNPIKPDFDAEDFSNACAIWNKNAFYLSAPVNSKAYILEFLEDADGNLIRFWQPPQILPVRPFSVISGDLHGHSNGVPETYKLFDGYSDTASDDDKLPINCIAKFAYNSYKKRASLKNFDEYFVEGEISPSTIDLLLSLNYDFGGTTQVLERTINGSDRDILEETLINASLGQQSLGQSPTGGSITAPDNTAKFQVIFELAKEDFIKMQPVFSTNEVDRYWSILAHGANVKLSRRQNIVRKK